MNKNSENQKNYQHVTSQIGLCGDILYDLID